MMLILGTSGILWNQILDWNGILNFSFLVNLYFLLNILMCTSIQSVILYISIKNIYPDFSNLYCFFSIN